MKRTDNSWHPYAERMSALAESFPCLVGKLGVRPWDPGALARWSKVSSHGENCAARFVLSVWSWGKFPGARRFDLMEAMGCWDSECREAAAAWMRAPFWP